MVYHSIDKGVWVLGFGDTLIRLSIDKSMVDAMLKAS